MEVKAVVMERSIKRVATEMFLVDRAKDRNGIMVWLELRIEESKRRTKKKIKNDVERNIENTKSKEDSYIRELKTGSENTKEERNVSCKDKNGRLIKKQNDDAELTK